VPPLHHSISSNRILSTLAAREPIHPVLTRLKPVSLVSAQVLVTHSASVHYGFFITNGMVCGVTAMNNGITTADQLIGSEGFAGISLLLGGVTMQPGSVIVQIAGTAMRIDADVFLHEFNRHGLFRDLMRRYTFSRMASITQTAACNAVHCVQERMACCLLRTADRVGPEFKLTHEAIAQMLGNRRATVSTQAESFERLKLISYRYGRIRIEDRRGLEELACECYQLNRQVVESVFTLPH